MPRPAARNNRAQATYLTRALDIAARSLRTLRALAWTPSINHALAIEAQGLSVQRQEIPAIRGGDLGRARALDDRAARLTHPADLVLKRAGLGACVGA